MPTSCDLAETRPSYAEKSIFSQETIVNCLKENMSSTDGSPVVPELETFLGTFCPPEHTELLKNPPAPNCHPSEYVDWFEARMDVFREANESTDWWKFRVDGEGVLDLVQPYVCKPGYTKYSELMLEALGQLKTTCQTRNDVLRKLDENIRLDVTLWSQMPVVLEGHLFFPSGRKTVLILSFRLRNG